MKADYKRERHGMSRTPTYKTWVAMKQRCYDVKHKAYARYGGNGIQICDRWRMSFVAFLTDMGERPEGKTLDRINNSGDYTPENCRWATGAEQANNTRRTRHINVNGQKLLAIEIAHGNGISSGTFHGRIHAGWTTEQAVGLEEHCDPRGIAINGETMTKAQWAKRNGITRQALFLRLRRGWDIEKALTIPNLICAEHNPDQLNIRIGEEYNNLLCQIAECRYLDIETLLKLWIDEHAKESGLAPIRTEKNKVECHQ